MADLYDKIGDLSKQVLDLQDALQQALEAGLAYKANAEEGAKRVEQAERRIYELEKNKELFQQQRDEAIRERDRARQICDRVMKSQPIPTAIERLNLSPGELVIFRLVKDAANEELEAFGGMVRWLKRFYPANNFITFANRLEVELETLAETDLRQLGLILTCRVDAGIQQLEAAFGTHAAALKEARTLLGASIEGRYEDELQGHNLAVHKLVEQLDKILAVELKPEARPTREQLLDLLRECRPHLVWNTDGDTRERESSADLERRISAATGDPVDDDGREDA